MNMKINNPDSRQAFLAGLIILAVLPSVLLVLVWQNVYTEYARNLDSAGQAAISKDLARIRRESDNAFFIEKQLNQAYGLMTEEPVTSKNIGRHLQVLKDQGLDFVNFRFFDRQRQLIPVSGESEKLRAIIQKLFAALSQIETEGKTSLLESSRSIFASFLGAVNPASLASARSSLAKVLVAGNPGYFYWNMFYSPDDEGKFLGGMVAWFSENDIPANVAVKQLLTAYSQDAKTTGIYGVLDLSVPENSIPERLAEPMFPGGLPRLKNEVAIMRQSFVSHKVIAGRLLSIVQVNADRVLYFVGKTTNAAAVSSFLAAIFLIVFLPVVFYAAQTLRCTGKGWRQFLAGRPAHALCLASTFPILLLAIVGWSLSGMHRQVLRQQAWEKLSAHIGNIDESYVVALGNLEKTYRRFALSGALTANDATAIKEGFAQLVAADAMQRLYIIDSKGKILLGLPDNGTPGAMVSKLMTAVGRRLFLAKFGGEQSWKDKVDEVMLESFTSSLSDLLGDASASLFKPFENFDKVSEITFADRRNYVFSTFLEPEKKDNSRLMVVWHSAESFAERYLLKQVRRNMTSSEYEQPVRLAMVSRKPGQWPYPREFSKYPFVFQLSERVTATSAQQYSIEQVAGQECLVAAAPMKKIPDYLVFAMLPAGLIDASSNRLVAMLVAAVFSCLLLAWWVSRQIFNGSSH